MRAIAIMITTAAFASACHLDASSKPECFDNDDCHYFNGTFGGGGHKCREQVCYVNLPPVATMDVIYVLNPTMTSFKVEANVVANDSDADGDHLKIHDVDYLGSFSKKSETNIEVTVNKPLPMSSTYRVTDGYMPSEPIAVVVAKLVDNVTVRLESGASADIASVFATIVDTSPAALELAMAPTHGTLTGTLPNLTYVSPADFCGTDFASFRVNAANGVFYVTVNFEVGVLLDDDQQTVELGTPVTIDVLANDPDGLEIIGTDTAWATPDGTGGALVIDPPTNKAQTFDIEYQARDSRGCTGKATLTLAVEYPTRVLVGTGLTGDAFDASISDNGRYVAFTSADATLVSGDTNGAADVFVLDIQTNAIERVSVATNGTQANESSSSPSISADGRHVAFVSRATNFSAQDTTSIEDIYVHDRVADTTTLASISVDNTGSDRPSLTPHISSNGARVVFASTATRLVSDDTNDVMDVFVRDLPSTTTQRVSVTGAGAQVPFASYTRPRISGNGRYVALSSTSSLDGSNSGGAFFVDTSGSAVSRIDSSAGEADLDDVGRFVIHADYQVNLIDRVVENTTLLGLGTYPSVSADGRFVAYVNAKRILGRGAGSEVDAIVDRAGAVLAVTPLRRPEISGNGRWIVFSTSEWPSHLGRFVIVRVWNRAYVE
jgi:Tol biopolymer transport system component